MKQLSTCFNEPLIMVFLDLTFTHKTTYQSGREFFRALMKTHVIALV